MYIAECPDDTSSFEIASEVGNYIQNTGGLQLAQRVFELKAAIEDQAWEEMVWADAVFHGETDSNLDGTALSDEDRARAKEMVANYNHSNLVSLLIDAAMGGIGTRQGGVGRGKVTRGTMARGRAIFKDLLKKAGVSLDSILPSPVRKQPKGPTKATKGTLTSSSGNYTPTHTASAGDALDTRLPGRQTGQPTNGVIDVDGAAVHLQSGVQGPAYRWYDPSKPAVNQTATHVEGHATALMVDNGITEMTVTINNRLGPCRVCRNQIPDLLPQGSTLNVRWMDRNGVVQTTPIHGRAPTGQ